MTERRIRLGIDIGGTFTDLVTVDEVGGELRTMKVPSRPADPAGAVREGIERLGEAAGIDPGEIVYFVHGTTIALNTLIQRAGARTGLIITRGFGDVLEIGRLRLPNPNDFMCERPEPLVPRHLVAEIDERILANGEVLRPLDLAGLADSADRLVEAGVEAIAVCSSTPTATMHMSKRRSPSCASTGRGSMSPARPRPGRSSANTSGPSSP